MTPLPLVIGDGISMKRHSKSTQRSVQQGLSMIGYLLLITVVFILLAVGFFEGRKAYWDYRVHEMCERDGRIQILEKISVTKQYLDRLIRYGVEEGLIKMKESVRSDDLVYLESKEINIREGSPRIRRTDWIVVRQSDKKTVAQWSSFGRIGGDIPAGLVHDSSFRCPEWQQSWTELLNLFVITN